MKICRKCKIEYFLLQNPLRLFLRTKKNKNPKNFSGLAQNFGFFCPKSPDFPVRSVRHLDSRAQRGLVISQGAV